MELGRIVARRKQGDEPFLAGGEKLPFDLLDFWRWSGSDLVSNTSRGILAEYIVGRALGSRLEVRDEWVAYDLEAPGGIRVEVKSAAYIQSWHQKRPSAISFGCAKARGWNPDTGEEDSEPARHSDVYVFALLKHTEQESLDPLNVDQWEFFAVPTVWLDERERSQHSITLPSLRTEFTSVNFAGLAAAVTSAARNHRG